MAKENGQIKVNIRASIYKHYTICKEFEPVSFREGNRIRAL